MADRFFQLKSFLSYWLDAVDEHSLHSPFFFDFYVNVLKPGYQGSGTASIEKLREQLLRDKRSLSFRDPGSGSHSIHRTVSDVARNSLTPTRFSGIYSKIIDHFKLKTILELGTSLGINTLYLAMRKDSHVTTFEGSAEIADIAMLTFEFAGARNIQLVRGNLDHTLSAFLQSIRRIDFIFMDANHRYQPTIRYFKELLPRLSEASILVMDDIHYSPEMHKAWEEIKKHPLVYGTADLFRCGVVFFDPSLNKQHVILQV